MKVRLNRMSPIWLCFARIFTTEAQRTRSRSQAISRYELGILSVTSVSLW